MRLFVDTSAWYALSSRGDAAHERAVRLWGDLRRRTVRLFTTDHVFAESVTLTRVRLGHAAACELGNLLLGSQVLEITEVPADIRSRAWDVFQKYSDKEFSFVDCTSFVVMQDLRLTDAFTFDKHFHHMGIKMWPHPQPSLRPLRG